MYISLCTTESHKKSMYMSMNKLKTYFLSDLKLPSDSSRAQGYIAVFLMKISHGNIADRKTVAATVSTYLVHLHAIVNLPFSRTQ